MVEKFKDGVLLKHSPTVYEPSKFSTLFDDFLAEYVVKEQKKNTAAELTMVHQS